METLDLSTMKNNAAKAEQLLSLMANRHRLMALCNLIDGEKTAGQLLEKSSLGQSALSQHMAKLREAELVSTRREGQMIYYKLASKEARKMIETLCEFYLD